MIRERAYPVEPWHIRETRLDLDLLAQSESVFALANGHIGLRGNLDEGEPHGLPGTYLNSFYELRPLPYAEAGYGFPESGQTIVNVTNGKLIRLLVDDEPFDVRYGELRSHERVLDLRAGTLRPRAWSGCSPAGQAVRVRTTRLVSFTQRAVAAILLRGRAGRRAAAADPAVRAGRQRAAAADAARTRGWRRCWSHPLQAEEHAGERRPAACWCTAPRRSGLRMAAGDGPRGRGAGQARHHAPRRTRTGLRTTVACVLEPGEKLRVVKLRRVRLVQPALAAGAARPGRRRAGQRPAAPAGRAWWRRSGSTWTRSGTHSDVQVEGDPEVQQAVRFGAVPRAAGRCPRRAAADRGQGPDRPGLRRPHLLGHRDVRAAGADLHPAGRGGRTCCAGGTPRWTWPGSGRSTLGLRGAAFPWRTIRGQECSAYWPAGTAAFHIGADIADAVRALRAGHRRRRLRARDRAGAAGRDRPAVALAGPPRPARPFHIDGVTGPDEYTAVVRRQRLHQPDGAAEPVRRRRGASAGTRTWPAELGVDDEEIGVLAGRGRRPCTSRTTRSSACTSSREGFTRLQEWDFDEHAAGGVPAAAATTRTSTCTASRWSSRPTWCWRCTGAATRSPPSEKARNFAYYERVPSATRRCRPAPRRCMAAEVGHLELAHDYLGEAALMDLHDLHDNTRDGVHIAVAGRRLARAGRRPRRHARPRRAAVVRAAAARAGSTGWSSRCCGAGCGCGSRCGRRR